MKRVCLLITAVIMTALLFSACVGEKIDDLSSMKNFWEEHRDELETTAKEMREQGIEFFIQGVPLKIENGRNQKVENVSYSDAMRTIVDLCRYPRLDAQFGWYYGSEPFFTGGDGYFYVASRETSNEYGEKISFLLVFSENPVSEIDPYTTYEDLGGGWLLVTEHLGE